MAENDPVGSPGTAKMTKSSLLTLIKQYELASLGSQVAAGATISTTVYPSNQAMTTLQVDRYNALNAFYARPLGNEVENRSQVVLPVVRDTLSWIMPQLMRMFATSKTVCRFDPENQQDEQQAELETEVVNHVFMNQNDGTIVLHDFFWDALLLRNGYAEVYTREWQSVKEEKYTGLDEVELTSLLQDTADEKLEVLEQREYLEDLVLPLPQTGQVPALPPGAGLEAAPPAPQQPLIARIPAFDIKLRRTKKNKRIVACCVPAEEMRISARATNTLETVSFAAHITTKTRTELIQDGFDKKLVNGITSTRPDWLDIDALARNKLVDQLSIEDPSDFSMQELEFRNVVMRVDFDGDGVAELRRVQVAGDTVILNEVLEETSFVSCQGIRMPHRHTGLSLYDLVMDLQVIKTNLLRAGLDNLTIANNLRIAVDWRRTNIDDLLTSRPHGPIRGDGPPDQWIKPMQMPTNVMSEVVPMLGYMDQLKTERTGVGKGTMGMDADELQNVTKGGQLAAMSAAALIVELMARMLAEGCKGVYSKIRNEMIRNQDKPLWYKIRGKWIEVDPSSWRSERTVQPNVGLGSGNREELRANVQILGGAQQAAAQMGLVGPKQAFETFKVMCESLGFPDPDRFAMDPSGQEYAQAMKERQQAAQNAPQAPQVQAAKIRAQTTLIQQQAENQRAQADAQVSLTQAREQQIHEALQAAQQQVHEGLQGGGDRGLQILLKLIQSIGQVIAADKGDPNELGPDVQWAQGELT